ncbi:class I SAM-dependent methyltransferase [Profundibacterium mesophilum]|uniref:Ribosomal RNA small subunit methyltransferase n=1 Tax=Profundibacterium mesophilum KAUST100406-0324 TaxID=1037889 RepID=A0A921TD42_9RHOB|nr:methyltransferase [Profundibacterium mesophilum]KAF0675717.1 Ribosomal RNA small subunit methyltransferase [Profundibacterium mesophilum KAUST100406-0324]
MLSSRLSIAAADGLLPGEMLVFGARGHDDLSALGGAQRVVQGFRPDVEALERAGHSVTTTPEGAAPAALVVLPRAKAQARDRIARAAAASEGAVWIDGQKTDGADSLLREIRKRARTGAVISKAHGKLFEVLEGDFSDWIETPSRNAAGFWTAPGSFSADDVDAGSALLADALPQTLKGRVIDLGAGWGYLSSKVLEREEVGAVELVEADALSLDCARRNIDDPRAVFHWADARGFRPARPADHVVANPPFHTGRDADPGLGRAFIAAAAACLTPSGGLWLVANRHLPYESVLNESFARVTELPGAPAFKLYHAQKPRRTRR